MKKIILCLLLLFSTTIFAQSPIKLISYKSSYATMQLTDEGYKWIFSSPEWYELEIYFSNKEVRINNEARSVFRIVKYLGKSVDRLEKSPYTKFTTLSFSVVDNKNKNCQVHFVLFDDPEMDVLFNVLYDDFWFKFNISTKSTPSGLDRLID